eukprot:149890_1
MCTQVFGTKIDDSSIEMYFHGLSSLFAFSSFVAVFNSPTSTTPQLEVATLFAKTGGAILELRQDVMDLRYFNSSWLSCFANEDERLFCGTNIVFKIHDIIE